MGKYFNYTFYDLQRDAYKTESEDEKSNISTKAQELMDYHKSELKSFLTKSFIGGALGGAFLGIVFFLGMFPNWTYFNFHEMATLDFWARLAGPVLIFAAVGLLAGLLISLQTIMQYRAYTKDFTDVNRILQGLNPLYTSRVGGVVIQTVKKDNTLLISLSAFALLVLSVALAAIWVFIINAP